MLEPEGVLNIVPPCIYTSICARLLERRLYARRAYVCEVARHFTRDVTQNARAIANIRSALCEASV